MKVRIFPKKEVVRGHLQAQLDEEQGFVDAQILRLEELDKSVLFVANNDKAIVKTSILNAEDNIKLLQDQLKFLDAHGPEEVMMEINL